MIHKLLLISLILFSCTRKNEVTVRVASNSKIDTIDPAKAYDEGTILAISQTYESLFEYHYLKRPYRLQPLLAESLPEWSRDRMEVTIKIKKGVPYHDQDFFAGKKRYVKAQDFINQIKRIAFKPLKSEGLWLFKSKLIGFNEFREKVGDNRTAFFSEDISGIETPNEYTLKMKFKVPVPELIHQLAMTFVVPIPIEALKYDFDILKKRMVGTGPFIPLSIDMDKALVFRKFASYKNSSYPTTGDRYSHTKKFLKNKKKTIPFVDKIEMLIIPEQDDLWARFLNNQLDWIDVPKNLIPQNTSASGGLSKDLREKDIEMLVFPSFSSLWLSFNMSDPLLGKNLNLRKAIAYAINVDKYLDKVTNRTTQQANSIYFPGIRGYNPSRKKPIVYDIEKAKKFLAKAGFPEGKSLPTISYYTRGVSKHSLTEANFVKESLKEIGIDIKIKETSFGDFLTNARDGKLQFFTDGWQYDLPDSRNILQLLISPSRGLRMNKSQYSNSKVDAMIDRIGKMDYGQEFNDLLMEIEDEVFKDLPWVLLYYNRTYVFHHSNIRNLRYSSFIRNYYKYIDKI